MPGNLSQAQLPPFFFITEVVGGSLAEGERMFCISSSDLEEKYGIRYPNQRGYAILYLKQDGDFFIVEEGVKLSENAHIEKQADISEGLEVRSLTTNEVTNLLVFGILDEVAKECPEDEVFQSSLKAAKRGNFFITAEFEKDSQRFAMPGYMLCVTRKYLRDREVDNYNANESVAYGDFIGFYIEGGEMSIVKEGYILTENNSLTIEDREPEKSKLTYVEIQDLMKCGLLQDLNEKYPTGEYHDILIPFQDLLVEYEARARNVGNQDDPYAAPDGDLNGEDHQYVEIGEDEDHIYVQNIVGSNDEDPYIEIDNLNLNPDSRPSSPSSNRAVQGRGGGRSDV